MASRTPTEVIQSNRQLVIDAHPALVSLFVDRGEGALQAMCSLGLIDGNTYLEAGRDLYDLGKRRQLSRKGGEQ
jgi:hypothetical protein